MKGEAHFREKSRSQKMQEKGFAPVSLMGVSRVKKWTAGIRQGQGSLLTSGLMALEVFGARKALATG